MLTLEEAGLSLKAFKIVSILNIFPIAVDVVSGKIQRQSKQVKVLIWKILFGIGVSHWFYMFGRLVQSILEPEKYFRWDHFAFHLGFTCAYAVFYFTAFCLFVKNREENVMIFNQLFEEREDPVQKMIEQSIQLQLHLVTGNQDNNKTRAKSATRPLLTWPPQYSIDELVAKLLPSIGVSTGAFTILIMAIDPSRPQLLYSSLPPEYQNLWSFFSLLAVETLCLNIVFRTCDFTTVTQIMFFGKCQLEFKQMSLQLRNLQEKFQTLSFENGIGNGGREVEKEIWILRQILKEMRELVVMIELFNRCFPFPIFAWKICCLSMSIIFYFFIIRHAQDFPVLGFYLGYAGILVTSIYMIAYEHAFSIPGKMEELKNEFLLTAQKTAKELSSSGNLNTFRAEMKREIKRIRGVGIKVGNFNKMERESTPNFIDFVLRNVVSLLVTFPR